MYVHTVMGVGIVALQVKYFQSERTIEIQLVRPTEVCGKVLKAQSLSVTNVTSTDVRLATILTTGRHWLTSQIPSINVTEWSAEIVQRN